MFCQVEVSASGWSLVQRSTSECGVSECEREASVMMRPWPTGGMLRRGGKKDFAALSVTNHNEPCVYLGTNLEKLLRQNSGCCRRRDMRLHSQTEQVLTIFGKWKQHFGGRRDTNNERVELAVWEWLQMNIRKKREGYIFRLGGGVIERVPHLCRLI